MDGRRHEVISADGTPIGLLTAGTGPALLLVHGGMGRLERWEPMWGMLTARWQVTAMDRRGRGSSGDTAPYHLSMEFDDVIAVAAAMTAAAGSPVDVLAHSYGATCTLGAAARSAAAGGEPFRRIALYEPPGPQAAPADWRERATSFIAAGQPGRAMASFLSEIIGLSRDQIEDLRSAAGAQDVLPIVSATMPREAAALAAVDLPALTAGVTIPVLLILGAASPAWAGDITRELEAALADATVAVLPDCGHEAIDSAPGQLADVLARFLRR